MTVLPKPAKRLDVWLGGKAPSELRRVGKLADGWLASFSTPEDCKAGRDAIEEATAAAGRSIDDDHFGAMVFYTHDAIPERVMEMLTARNPSADSNDLVATDGRRCASSASATSRSVSRSSCWSRSPSRTRLGRRARARRRISSADSELIVTPRGSDGGGRSSSRPRRSRRRSRVPSCRSRTRRGSSRRTAGAACAGSSAAS